MGIRRQRLARRRRMLGLSQEQLAERVGVDRSTVARWERGESAPHPWHRPAIVRALKLTAEQLDELLAEHAVGSESAVHLDHVLAQPAVTDLAAIACLREQVASLGAAYDTMPSAALLADAGQCLGQIGYLRHHAASSRTVRELARAECEAALLMGKLVWDASARHGQQAPLAFLDQAIAAARQLGDQAAEGHALLRKAYLALYGGGDPGNGYRLASAAAAAAEQTSNALTGLALAHAAEGCAMLGESRQCEKSLAEAETLLNLVDPADAGAGLFSPTQFCRIAGSCYLYLGGAARAENFLEAAAGMLADGAKSRAIVLGNLALACVRQGKLDLAAANLRDAITVIEQTWGGGGLAVVFAAGRELRPWRGEPVVQDTYDRLLALIAAE